MGSARRGLRNKKARVQVCSLGVVARLAKMKFMLLRFNHLIVSSTEFEDSFIMKQITSWSLLRELTVFVRAGSVKTSPVEQTQTQRVNSASSTNRLAERPWIPLDPNTPTTA
jgi:hypothetical protein